MRYADLLRLVEKPMSASVARLRSLFSPGVLPHLLFGFLAAALLFSTLHQFASGFMCIGYACPALYPLPGEQYCAWPHVTSIVDGLASRTLILSLLIVPLTLIGALFSVRSVWLWVGPWLTLTAMVAVFALWPEFERRSGNEVRIWIAFSASAFAFLAPLLVYHFLGWRRAATFAS
jgi:hypothetical protein